MERSGKAIRTEARASKSRSWWSREGPLVIRCWWVSLVWPIRIRARITSEYLFARHDVPHTEMEFLMERSLFGPAVCQDKCHLRRKAAETWALRRTRTFSGIHITGAVHGTRGTRTWESAVTRSRLTPLHHLYSAQDRCEATCLGAKGGRENPICVLWEQWQKAPRERSHTLEWHALQYVRSCHMIKNGTSDHSLRVLAGRMEVNCDVVTQ